MIWAFVSSKYRKKAVVESVLHNAAKFLVNIYVLTDHMKMTLWLPLEISCWNFQYYIHSHLLFSTEIFIPLLKYECLSDLYPWNK